MTILPRWLMGVALCAPVLLVHAQAVDPLPPETVLVGLPGSPPATEETFTIAVAEDLLVTLTDLQVPAALSTATVVLTQGGALVGNSAATAAATLAPPATTATLTVPGAVGVYTLRVFGAPNASNNVGTFSVCVAPKSSPSNCIQNASLLGNISTPAVATPTASTVSVPVTVTTGGNYTVSYADESFPAALQGAPMVALFQGGVAVGPLPIPSGTQLNLAPATYTLLAVAQAAPAAQAGLFSINISATGIPPVLSASYPVGKLMPASQAINPSAQSLTLSVKDFAFPASLAQASVLATSGSTVLGSTSSSAGVAPANFAAPAGPVQVWTYAAAGADAGTYEVDLTSTAGSLLETAYGVNNGNSLAFAYVSSALTAGSYTASASDFQFPSVLQGLQFEVAQSGSVVASAAMPSTVNFTAAAGPVALLVNAKAPASGNGLFDISVQTSGAAPQLQFDRTQAVSLSALFDTQTVNLGTSGNYNVTLSDLQFPAQFQNLDLVVSSGGVILGKIIGGGTFPIVASPGAYQLTFIATPATQQQYGMYALQITNAVPTVTLTASPTTVTAGGLSTLTWTSSAATSCTGSGGAFAGNQPVNSGSVAVSVASTTTFTLSCTGAGGTASQSVTVTATAPAGKSGGGGGMDITLLSLLALIALSQAGRKRAGSRPRSATALS